MAFPVVSVAAKTALETSKLMMSSDRGSMPFAGSPDIIFVMMDGWSESRPNRLMQSCVAL